MGVSPARQAAFNILLRIETGGAYSDELLHSSLIKDLDGRDRDLAFELVLGSLRRQGEIDYLIGLRSRQAIEKLDPEVRIALRMGCYQILFLDRIPTRAAVWESVELVKRARKGSAARFVNAVLRGLPKEPPPDALDHSHPKWMRERWEKIHGREATGSLLNSNLSTPPTYLRLSARRPVETIVRRLEEEGVESEPTDLPRCRLLREGRPLATECYRQGVIRIQDISSQMIVPMLDLQPGSSFLDVCAAPGGKTFQALDLLRRAGGSLSAPLIACDRHLHRLQIMRRLAPEPIDLAVIDAEQSLPFRRPFDRILVDAPCSGTGTLARNPEIKWRLRPEDLDALSTKQRNILTNALGALASGGVLVYATCSLEPEENREVVEAVVGERRDLSIRAYLDRLPGRDAGDGFFACKIVRHAS